jgi:predicted  nucleic acid-binding Zn-ribbon protein
MGKICIECMEFITDLELKNGCPNCGNPMKEKYNKVVKDAIKTYFNRLLQKPLDIHP